MLSQVAVLCLISLAAAQYRPQYEAPSYPKPYEPDYDSKPEPYSFGYDIKDEYGATQNRKEESDGYGNVKGSYGYTDGYGIYRHVDYVADDKGFRAYVKTNEPGTDNQNPADVEIHSEAAPVKYDGPSYDKPPAYSRPAAPTYSQPPPIYRPAPAAYAPVPSYQPAQPHAYPAPAEPRPYHPEPAPYAAPEPAKYQPAPAYPTY